VPRVWPDATRFQPLQLIGVNAAKQSLCIHSPVAFDVPRRARDKKGDATMKKLLSYVIAVTAACGITGAQAGDAEFGRQLAQSRCAACHAITAWQRDEVADAPPFAVIARKFSFDSGILIAALRGPHRKMNFRPTLKESADIAEYIRSIAH
jgi:mono/diheme cytochrome c family protein